MGQHATIHGKTVEDFNGASGKWIPVQVTASGALVTNASSTTYAEDAIHVTGDQGMMLLAVRRDVATSGVSNDGDYATLNVDNLGNLRVSGGVVPDESSTLAVAVPTSITTLATIDCTGYNKVSVQYKNTGSTALAEFEVAIRNDVGDFIATHTSSAATPTSDFISLNDALLVAVFSDATTTDAGVLPASKNIHLSFDVASCRVSQLRIRATQATSAGTADIYIHKA